MPELIDQLAGWLESLDSKHPAEWSLLPDIGLYMDQVQTYIDRQLGLYRRDAADRLLTPAMINNYIKDDLIPRAEFKKYAPVHLALLIMIGALKQVLSIPNLRQLLALCREPSDVAVFYSLFLKVQHESLVENASQVLDETKNLARAAGGETTIETSDHEADEGTEAALRNLALRLAIEARTRILIAEKILSQLAVPKAVPKPEEPVKKPVPGKA
jgi:hypothetical protein